MNEYKQQQKILVKLLWQKSRTFYENHKWNENYSNYAYAFVPLRKKHEVALHLYMVMDVRLINI